jgi:hypothetical protein
MKSCIRFLNVCVWWKSTKQRICRGNADEEIYIFYEDCYGQ